MTVTDIRELSDDELSAALERAREEYHRRRALVTVLEASPVLTEAHMQSIGRENGTEFVQPTGAHNAYPLGWEVTYEGVTWKSTRDGAHEVPGESPDWRRVADVGEILPWAIPHAGSEYAPGTLVTHQGHVWRNDYEAPNGWEPGTPHSQWTDLGTVEDPENPKVPEDPEENEILEWVQPPAGSEYPLGAIVSHEGHVWRNEHEANGWTPGTTGSQWTDLGPIEEYEGE